ncbi:MAG: AsnC family transcriptional regulator [Sporomusaceae bacterium]|nr:AsnC family transcriptional regulator [Sporomusaceae bacterium]
MLSQLDKAILNILQTKLPVASRPFAMIGDAVGCDEETVLSRVRWMKDNGYIRRIGPFFDSARLGYVGTLVAAEVDSEALAAVAQKINSYVGVTHNYEREGEFNLWFTLLSPSKAAQEQVLAEIAKVPGIRRLHSLPAQKKLKVNVKFDLK